MLSPWAWAVAGIVAGLLIGSFLNVCIARLPYGESVVKPRSHCPSCLFPIRWYDNIPLLSFVLLRARCRKCFQPIPWRYPLVELATALWFGMTAFRLAQAAATEPASVTQWIHATALLVAGFLLIGLLVMDWQTHRLPDVFTLTGAAIGFLLVCFQAIFLPAGMGDIHSHRSMRMSSPGSMVERGDVFLSGTEVVVFGRLLAIVAAAGLLLLVRAIYAKLRKREGLGLGDVKLMGMIAALLGFWPAMLALFAGMISASAYAVLQMTRGRATSQSRLPLGTFLCAGGLFAAAIGAPILAWYRGLL